MTSGRRAQPWPVWRKGGGRRASGLARGDVVRGCALGATAAVLAGCAELPASINPVEWWHNMQGGPLAEARPPPPGATDPYPNLASVPARPAPSDPKARQQIADALIADRTNAQHMAGEVLGDPSSQTASPDLFGKGSAPPPPPAAADSGQAHASLEAATAPPAPPAPPPGPSAPTSGTAQSAASAPSAPPAPEAAGKTAPANGQAASKTGNAGASAQQSNPIGPPPGAQTASDTLPPVAGAGALPALPATPPAPPSLPGTPIPQSAPTRVAMASPKPGTPQAPAGKPASEAASKPEAAKPAMSPVAVAFEPGSATLPASQLPALKAVAAHRGTASLAVIGYGEARTNDPEAQSAALALGLSRAQAIAAALAAAGVPATALQVDAQASGRGGAVHALN